MTSPQRAVDKLRAAIDAQTHQQVAARKEAERIAQQREDERPQGTDEQQ